MRPATTRGSRFSKVPLQTVQEFWDRRPCNIRHSTSTVGTKSYFDEVEQRKYLVEPHIPQFAEFDRWRGRKVLELGCGIGTDTINFARAGAQVTAVDLSPRSIQLAQRRAEVYGLGDRIKFYVADAENLSTYIPPEPYDLVYAFGVIHHTPYPARAIEEVRRNYVRSGTTLKLMVYHRYSWKSCTILVTQGRGRFWRMGDLVAKHSEAQTGCPVTYTYSRSDVKRLLGTGFDVRELRVNHIFPYRVSDYVEYRYTKVWYFNRLPAPFFRWLERRIGWHLCVTAEAV